MQIAGEIQHPKYKITIFHMNHRLAFKIEDGTYEQWYKYRDGELPNGIADIKEIVNTTFLTNADKIFAMMHENKTTHLIKPDTEDSFDQII